MRGTMVVIATNGDTNATVYDRALELEDLSKAVGGYIEVVPRFNRFSWQGSVERCVAFCNEQGKLNGLEGNSVATLLWHSALGRRSVNDVLVGPVAIVFGDEAFMREL